MTFSIVIPFYNLERYVAECLDSVLAQTYLDYEIICVNDGSSDKTAALLDSYAKRDKRIKVIHKANGGEGSARNAGIDAASGEWICYLDGDDIWAPTFLSDMIIGIATHPTADMVSVRQWNFKDNETIILPPHVNGMTVYDTSKSLSSELFMIGVWSTSYRRSVYGDLRFTNHCIGADRIYTMKCLSRSNCAIVCSAQDYGYRLRGNSMAHGALNAKKLSDGMDAARLSVELLAKSDKQMDCALCRLISSGWLEHYPSCILVHRSF